MASRFAALLSDSESDDDSNASPPQKPSPPPKQQQRVVEPVQPQYASTTSDFGGEGGFTAVAKKKSMKAQTVTKETLNKQSQIAQELHQTAQQAQVEKKSTQVEKGNGHQYTPSVQSKTAAQSAGSKPGGQMTGNGNIVSPVKGGKMVEGAVAADGRRKHKRKAGGAFAALAGDDEDENSDDDEEDVAEDDYVPVQAEAPVLPKQMGLLPTNSTPDYLAIVHMEPTRPFEERETAIQKNFHPETLSITVLFQNSKTKQIFCDWSALVRPSEFPTLSKQTTEETGITQDDLRQAQPLDEVLREFERWAKDKGLASINRNKKRGGNKMGSGSESEFVLVVSGLDFLKKVFRPEVARKEVTLPTMFKKFIDMKKLFCDNYKLKGDATLVDMLTHVCLEFEGVPHKHEPQNMAKVLSVMLDDCGSLTPNVTDKDCEPKKVGDDQPRGNKGKGKRDRY